MVVRKKKSRPHAQVRIGQDRTGQDHGRSERGDRAWSCGRIKGRPDAWQSGSRMLGLWRPIHAPSPSAAPAGLALLLCGSLTAPRFRCSEPVAREICHSRDGNGVCVSLLRTRFNRQSPKKVQDRHSGVGAAPCPREHMAHTYITSRSQDPGPSSPRVLEGWCGC